MWIRSAYQQLRPTRHAIDDCRTWMNQRLQSRELFVDVLHLVGALVWRQRRPQRACTRAA
jgi:hypothetical protein